MSNDLISREEAINRLIKCNLLGRKSCEQVAEMLKNLPTAYYVDKVVEQLIDETANTSKKYREAIYKSIEIVKAGGVCKEGN